MWLFIFLLCTSFPLSAGVNISPSFVILTPAKPSVRMSFKNNSNLPNKAYAILNYYYTVCKDNVDKAMYDTPKCKDPNHIESNLQADKLLRASAPKFILNPKQQKIIFIYLGRQAQKIRKPVIVNLVAQNKNPKDKIPLKFTNKHGAVMTIRVSALYPARIMIVPPGFKYKAPLIVREGNKVKLTNQSEKVLQKFNLKTSCKLSSCSKSGEYILNPGRSTTLNVGPDPVNIKYITLSGAKRIEI